MDIWCKSISVAPGGQTILENVSLEVPAGRQIAVKGPSGSGKSTLLKAILGLVPLTAGSIEVDGVPVVAASLAEVRAQIAYLPQQSFAGGATGREALLFPFMFKHNLRVVAEDEIVAALSHCGLSERVLALNIKELSGGEMQKLALARAILLNRPIWLLDEITSALDPASRETAVAMLKETGKTVVAISHDEAFLAAQTEVWELTHHNLHRVK